MALDLLSDEAEWTLWYEGLDAKEKEELARALESAPRVAPNEGPQTHAYLSEADVLGYGGAAGGGKSALIGILSILAHTRTVIYRYDAKQLRGLVDDIAMFWGTTVGLNRQAGVFNFGDRPGHMVEWGGIGGPGDENAWQGRPHDCIAVDEATQMQLKKIRWLMTWLRTTIPGQRCRAIMTFNPPGGPEDLDGSGRWVIEYFGPWIDERHPNPAGYGELRYYAFNPESGEEEEVSSPDPFDVVERGRIVTIIPKSRTFIPALVDDNPYLMATGYKQALMANLEEPLRSRMLYGDFSSGIVDDPWQTIPTKWVDEAMERWTPDGGAKTPMTALGVDVARGGRDNTILAPRHDWWWNELIEQPGTESPDGPGVAAFVIRNVRNQAEICIDVVGVGSSPYDFLKEAKANVSPVSGNRQHNLPAIDKVLRFVNLRSCLYWLMRKVLDPANGLKPALPKDKKLRAELLAPRFHHQGLKIYVEKKEDVVKRLGYSPDRADSVVSSLLHAMDTPGAEKLDMKRRKAVDSEGFRREVALAGASRNSWMSR